MIGADTGQNNFEGGIPPRQQMRMTFTPSLRKKTHATKKNVERNKMETYKGIDYLRKKLAQKRNRVLRRYKFYEMKNIARDIGIASPERLQWLQSVLGWNAKAVDSLADRLEFREFKDDDFDMNGIFRMNNPDILFDSAILSALISSCCFIYISRRRFPKTAGNRWIKCNGHYKSDHKFTYRRLRGITTRRLWKGKC